MYDDLLVRVNANMWNIHFRKSASVVIERVEDADRPQRTLSLVDAGALEVDMCT